MELALNNGFSELSFDEMFDIDGGNILKDIAKDAINAVKSDPWRALGYAATIPLAVCAVVGSGPIVAVGAGVAAGWYAYDAFTH